MILLKCLVLSPVDEVCVLDRGNWMSVTKKKKKHSKTKKDVRKQANNEAHPVVRHCLVCPQNVKPHSIFRTSSSGDTKHEPVDPQKKNGLQ
jgi:hypothetical protein